MSDIIDRLRSVNNTQAPYANDKVLGWCHEAAAEIERLRKKLIKAQEWYWPADDTSSDACMEGPWDYVLASLPGEIVPISCGGVVWTRYFAWLPPADDSPHDDDFEVDADTEEEADRLIKAEQARRAALSKANGESGT